MAAFATVADLEKRWRPLDADEKTRAQALLEDAAAIITAEAKHAGVDVAKADETDKLMLGMVSCDMVKRAMMASVDTAPATQGSMTVGPFSQSLTYANPMGELYMTKADKRRLGFKTARIGSLEPVCKWGEA